MLSGKFKDIDDYIRKAPKEFQVILKKMRLVISKKVPRGEEAIKYQMPTFRLNNTNLVHFAVLKNHLGFYPTPDPIVHFAKELKKYVSTKGAIQFPLDQPIPYDLVKKIVRYRVKQVLANK
jgi:uncharacterized protein YdhG (YjbR/CyaY superfamily)